MTLDRRFTSALAQLSLGALILAASGFLGCVLLFGNQSVTGTDVATMVGGLVGGAILLRRGGHRVQQALGLPDPAGGVRSREGIPPSSTRSTAGETVSGFEPTRLSKKIAFAGTLFGAALAVVNLVIGLALLFSGESARRALAAPVGLGIVVGVALVLFCRHVLRRDSKPQ